MSSYSTPFDRESDASEADPNDIAKILKVKHINLLSIKILTKTDKQQITRIQMI